MSHNMRKEWVKKSKHSGRLLDPKQASHKSNDGASRLELCSYCKKGEIYENCFRKIRQVRLHNSEERGIFLADTNMTFSTAEVTSWEKFPIDSDAHHTVVEIEAGSTILKKVVQLY
ncbi:hypothetical protein CEXT_394421 [Caerostris extrusa]|uniref:Uncharacterized protein n=1 Tax=Caerostris extrusa TaxID=172846 RepID=A0AAV4TGD0_CAEEX|nr:hypothetical protein CEXT_394421 [Caerostris extrusa]